MVAACPFPARRGTPLQIERLSEALTQLGHEVEVITYPIGELSSSPSFRIHRSSKSVEIGTIPPGPTISKLLRHDPMLARKIGQVLAEKSFDVIHAHHIEGLLTAWWDAAARALHWSMTPTPCWARNCPPMAATWPAS